MKDKLDFGAQLLNQIQTIQSNQQDFVGMV